MGRISAGALFERAIVDTHVAHDGGLDVAVVRDVGWVHYLEVDERERAAERADGVRAERPDVVDERVVDERVDSAVLEQVPSVLRGFNVRFACLVRAEWISTESARGPSVARTVERDLNPEWVATSQPRY